MPSLILKRGRYRWQAHVMVKGRRATRLFPDDSKDSQRAAAAWEMETKIRLKNLIDMVSSNLTLVKWVDDYLDECIARGFAKKTYQEKRSAFARLAQDPLFSADMMVEAIDRYKVSEYFKRQISTRTGNAVNKDRKNLAAAWSWGRNNLKGWPLGENPFLAVPKFQEKRSPRYVPPEEDFWKVYDAIATAAKSGEPQRVQDRVMMLSYLHLAARRSELFRLKFTDLDMPLARIRLWTRKRKDGSWEYDVLPMTSELKAELQMWAKVRLAQDTPDREHVFVCLDKNAWTTDYYGRPFRVRAHFMERWCKRAGVRPFGHHAIRHLAASILYKAGYSVGKIQKILRHKNANTTSRYLRTLGVDDVRDALENALQRSCKIVPFPSKKMASGGQS